MAVWLECHQFPRITILPGKIFTFCNREYSVIISVYLHPEMAPWKFSDQYNPKQFIILTKFTYCNSGQSLKLAIDRLGFENLENTLNKLVRKYSVHITTSMSWLLELSFQVTNFKIVVPRSKMHENYNLS